MSAIPEQYVPQDGRLFTVSMGLRALDIAQWFEIDTHYQSEIEQKRELYSSNLEQVFQVTEAGLAGSQETLELIRDHLALHFPKVVGNLDSTAAAQVSQEHHPLLEASLLVQEDLCIMSHIGDQWVLTAAAVCFPSRWDLTQKIGTNLHEIHAPVPHYEERIGQATDAMFRKFTSDRPVWRINWTILDKPELYQPATSHSSSPSNSGEGHVVVDEMSADLFARSTYLRIERQTLRALPRSHDVLFTIRTYVDSLANVASAYPDFRTHLNETLAGVSPETLQYKGWESLWNQLHRWATLTPVATP